MSDTPEPTLADFVSATPEQIRDLAAAISEQAAAIATGRLVGPLSMAVARILSNAETLRAWVPKP